MTCGFKLDSNWHNNITTYHEAEFPVEFFNSVTLNLQRSLADKMQRGHRWGAEQEITHIKWHYDYWGRLQIISHISSIPDCFLLFNVTLPLCPSVDRILNLRKPSNLFSFNLIELIFALPFLRLRLKRTCRLHSHSFDYSLGKLV